jgi:1,2-diacylglycerol 3-alpha-glucosyltransferase
MDGVIAPSPRVQQLLTRYEVKIHIRVIPTGADVAGINETPQRDVRPELGLKPDDLVLLTLSRIASEKKIGDILSVLPEIISQFPKTKLVIAGDGPDVDQLKAQVERLTLEDYVIFTGPIPHEDTGNYYRMADLFVSASDTETQGLTYIEALSAGTRCVVYKTNYTDYVYDQPELGSTFETKRQMLQEILAYLKRGQSKINQETLANKMQVLSAAHFGQEVSSFYRETIARFKQKEASND